MNYTSLARMVFGGITNSIEGHFTEIRDDLQKANISYTLNEYISVMIFTVALTFFIEALSIVFILSIFGFGVAASVMIGLTSSAIISVLLFAFFYAYPVSKKRSRGNKIKKVMPFAVSYMATIASSRPTPVTLFSVMSKFKEYGELSKEAKLIMRDIELLGMTLSSALKRATKRTPSAEFRDLLWGIDSVISTGGNLPDYLQGKTNEAMAEHRRSIKKYSQDLSLYVEIYLTLVITGSIFFIVLTSITAALTGGVGTVALQTFVVLVLVPIISIFFIFMIKSISPFD